MKKIHFPNIEKGQILPIVVIGLIVIISMTALILDGGSIMVNRRRAQNAADAGALAGGHDLCLNKAAAIVEATAIDYATNKNNATSATVEIVDKVITVTVQIQQNSFFARIFNQSNLTSSAVASAGCFPPSVANHLMPIAWSCINSEVIDNNVVCKNETKEWAPLELLLDSDPNYFKGTSGHLFPEIYIVMDSQSLSDDIVCSSDGGTVNCDINADGKNDIVGQGNRSWLDLDGGGGGAAELKNWVNGGYTDEVVIHTWFSSQPGNDNTIYDQLKNKEGQVVLIVVYDQTCDDNPLDKPECSDAAHSRLVEPKPIDEVIVGSSNTYFHAVGFGAFFVTCVHSKNGDKCPGFEEAANINPSIKNNTNSVEGYFVTGYPFNASDTPGGGADMGTYIVSLTK
ncbi:MAG: hypothetical protein C0410_02955 [Anaerolinea sp.]|nr:hypothetical protein [Anaerolinea sp.]